MSEQEQRGAAAAESRPADDVERLTPAVASGPGRVSSHVAERKSQSAPHPQPSAAQDMADRMVDQKRKPASVSTPAPAAAPELPENSCPADVMRSYYIPPEVAVEIDRLARWYASNTRFSFSLRDDMQHIARLAFRAGREKGE